MTVNLKRVVNKTLYHDPMNNFELREADSETRFDPLTGQLVRIFPFRKIGFPRFDWTPYVEESRKRFCPFCPDSLEAATPRYPDDFIPGGRLKVGEAVLVPNLHPYEKHTAVVVMTPRHYVPMREITVKLMLDSFNAGLEFLKIAAEKDPGGTGYCSINWNYMPYAGGSLIHPHLQVISGPEPSSYDGQMITAANEYKENNGANFWDDLVKIEREGERYIGKTGAADWLATFAPRALVDVTGVLPGGVSPEDLSQSALENVLEGFKKVVDYYDSVNVPAFNAVLYFAPRAEEGFRIHARIVGRYTIFPVVGSDVSHLQVLHNDPWTLHMPESLAGDLKTRF
ncbi:hypothetical protein DCCM_4078 [Desulfocucumis palustris]|uniref:Galactose-1-phosphate uridylyltransferase n=1 Tax=Desulfocucumis palustris TaxID=1898651 RepID=A0A2L2XFD7_9FIRM|nr:hypothetical protein [Desulfocucumis palustris]GBF34958.1 hypothetical protein DCCM_4078 [Desulfocucumis palustris]